jgi:hypothetical protein
VRHLDACDEELLYSRSFALPLNKTSRPPGSQNRDPALEEHINANIYEKSPQESNNNHSNDITRSSLYSTDGRTANGMITRPPPTSDLRAWFDFWDTNPKDGKLSRQEVVRAFCFSLGLFRDVGGGETGRRSANGSNTVGSNSVSTNAGDCTPPVDCFFSDKLKLAKLRQQVDFLWQRWDSDGNGEMSMDEFLQPKGLGMQLQMLMA